jgi:hypothetical protein
VYGSWSMFRSRLAVRLGTGPPLGRCRSSPPWGRMAQTGVDAEVRSETCECRTTVPEIPGHMSLDGVPMVGRMAPGDALLVRPRRAADAISWHGPD